MVLFLRSVESIFRRLFALPSSVLFWLLRPIIGANALVFFGSNSGSISHVGQRSPLGYIQRRLSVCRLPMPLSLTSGSSRSLRSLGQAKACPLT